MSIATTSNQSSIEDVELAALVDRCVHQCEHPVTSEFLFKSYPDLKDHFKPKRQLDEFLERLVQEGSLFKYPPKRGKKPRFFDQPPDSYARGALESLFAKGKSTFSNAQKSLKHEIPQVDGAKLKLVLNQLVQEGKVFEHPKVPGGRSVYFSTNPPDAEDYLRNAAKAFSKNLEKVKTQLADYCVSYEEVLSAARRLLPQLTAVQTENSENVTGHHSLVRSDLPKEIIAAFEQLKREEYTSTELVPIHAVRRKIHAKLGGDQASHRRFDPACHKLWDDGAISLIAISDLSRASNAELEASIPGQFETFFYMRGE